MKDTDNCMRWDFSHRFFLWKYFIFLLDIQEGEFVMFNSKKKKTQKNKANAMQFPQTNAETIPYKKVYKSGIFEIEDGLYSKTYKLPPLNFKTASTDTQQRIAEAWSVFLGSLPDDVTREITIYNQTIDIMRFQENIMIPMLLEKLSEDEWKAIYDESDEIGYLLDEVAKWEPKKATSNIDSKKEDVIEEGYVKLPSGHFKIEELTWMLNTLPFDVTFVDKNNEVKYFSEGKERTFPRTRAIIGRNVSNCHPP